MRTLFLSPDVPQAPLNGGDIRQHNVLSALLEEHEVVYAALCREGGPGPGWGLLRELPTPPLLVGPAGRAAKLTPEARRLRSAFRWPGGCLPQGLDRWDSAGFWNCLAELPLDEFDAVHVMHQTMAVYGLALKARFPRLKLVFDVDNILSVVRARELRAEGRPLYSRWRWRAQLNVWHLRAWERRAWGVCDSVWLCSEADRQVVPRALRHRTAVVPNGVDCAFYEDLPAGDDSRRLIFVGDMAYNANEQGVSYFCHSVLPLVRREVPDAEFWVVGRRPTAAVRRLEAEAPGVRVTGEVADVRPFLAGAAVSVVPLLVGGGTRLKILEAMAAGLPVVSTTIGAEGLEAPPGRAILLADAPAAFADACVRLLRQPELRRSLGGAGREFARQRFDWAGVRRKLRAAYAALGPRAAAPAAV